MPEFLDDIYDTHRSNSRRSMKHWIDPATITSWQYPVNFPLRDYQFNIVQECLFKNTLVSIPTGLGKTFIAGVVMMNFLRWFPFEKVCFLAPTRPLVAQQMAACKSIGINEGLMVELTGSTAPFQRQALWKGKRVFFLTPQIMLNDILKGICPCEFITCLVIDESHLPRGKHSYCQVVKDLWGRIQTFGSLHFLQLQLRHLRPFKMWLMLFSLSMLKFAPKNPWIFVLLFTKSTLSPLLWNCPLRYSR